METAHRPAEELAVFRDLRPEIGFGLGVVDIKSTEIETADQIARAIERAEKVLGAGRDQIHPSGLRLLDAQAQHRGRQDPRAGAGARSPSRTRGLRDSLYCDNNSCPRPAHPARANRSLTANAPIRVANSQSMPRIRRGERRIAPVKRSAAKISAKQIGIASTMK